MMFPKPTKKRKKKVVNDQKVSRLIDPAAIEAAKKPRSELSGLPTYGIGPHHWYITVGAGGPDYLWNLIQLNSAEHVKAHTGEITKEELAVIVAEREGVTVEYLMAEIRKMKGCSYGLQDNQN